MKTLYLLRHAHTDPAAPPMLGDYERVLSLQGKKDALAVGKFMQAQDMYPDFVLSSSSIRTIQTARLIFGTLFEKTGIRINSNFDRKLYQAPVEKIISEIWTVNASIQRLLVVGHNPGMAELAFNLGKIKEYTPGTLSVFTTACDSWADFSPASAKMETVFVPE